MSTIASHEFAKMLRAGRCVKGLRHNGQRIQDSWKQSYYGLTDKEVVEFNLAAQPAERTMTGRYTTAPVIQQYPKEVSMTPTELVKNAELTLAATVLAKEAADAHEALASRFDHDRELAEAALNLINDSAHLRKFGKLLPERKTHASFRKELQPLAESYGVKIVLVGDKTTAMLVLA